MRDGLHTKPGPHGVPIVIRLFVSIATRPFLGTNACIDYKMCSMMPILYTYLLTYLHVYASHRITNVLRSRRSSSQPRLNLPICGRCGGVPNAGFLSAPAPQSGRPIPNTIGHKVCYLSACYRRGLLAPNQNSRSAHESTT